MINNNHAKCSDFNYKGVACEIFNIDQNMKDNYKYTNNLININRIKKNNDYDNFEFLKKFIKVLKIIILFIYKFFCYIFKKIFFVLILLFLKLSFVIESIIKILIFIYDKTSHLLIFSYDFIYTKKEIIFDYINQFNFQTSNELIGILCNIEKSSTNFIGYYATYTIILYFFGIINFFLKTAKHEHLNS